MRRGQGTFEYVLLLGGVLLIVVLAIIVLQNTAQQGIRGGESKTCTARLLTDTSCLYGNGTWKQCGVITAADYPQCGAITYPGCVGATSTQKYCGQQPLQQ